MAEDIAALYTIPVPLQKIVEDEDLMLYYDDYGSDTFDGLTIYNHGQKQFYIHLNTARKNMPNNTKGRFTLAHELGHYFIDHHRMAMISGKMKAHWHVYNPFGDNEAWQIEREADSFAAGLLMPLNYLKEDLRGKKFGGELIYQLAQKYNVSFSAMSIRLMKMDYQSLMLVYAEDGMMKWQLHSEDFPFYQLRYGKTRVPEYTVMGEYFSSKDESNCRQNEIVFAGDCFNTFNEEQNDMQFYEYCIPYKNKAFSVFWRKS